MRARLNLRAYARKHANKPIAARLAAQGITPQTSTVSPGKAAEDALAGHLEAAGIPFERQVPVVKGRRWRLDFLCAGRVAVEVEGGVHRISSRFAGDMDKYNHVALRGLTLIRCTPAQARSGDVVTVIRGVLERGEKGEG